NASVACTALKAKIGSTTFAQAYTSFGACVSAMTSVEQQNIAGAQASCTAEQADPVAFASLHGGKTFAQFYGTGKNDKNAFGKCVSSNASVEAKAKLQASIAATTACATERTANVAAFNAKYGSFKSCVAQNTKSS